MLRSRIAALSGISLCAAAAAWSCSSFSPGTPEEADGGDAAPVEAAAAADTSMPDTSVNDAGSPDADADAVVLTPCADGGGTVLFTSSFDNGAGPSLAGWTVRSFGMATMSAEATDAGAVARGIITAKSVAESFAIIERGTLPLHFAVRFSFRASALVDSYIVSQFIDGNTTLQNLSLSLQPGGWVLAVPNTALSVTIGGRGMTDAWHTVAYRVDGNPDGGAIVSTTFDTTVPISFDLSSGTAIYKVLQLGPFWPQNMDAPGNTVDYANVTAWDCAP